METSDIVASVALFFSVVSAVVTISLSRREVKTQGYETVMGVFLRLDEIFITYPETRHYFYGNHELPEELDQALKCRITGIAEMMLDVCEMVIDTRFGLKADDEGSWIEYVVGCLKSSPVMRDHLTTQPSWHPRTYKLYLKNIDRILDAEEKRSSNGSPNSSDNC